MMSKNRKGPKQQDHPDLPQSPEQPYGEPLSGSHKVKNKNHSRQNKNASHDM
jgi:small acid-soluble spore protein P (minor)